MASSKKAEKLNKEIQAVSGKKRTTAGRSTNVVSSAKKKPAAGQKNKSAVKQTVKEPDYGKVRKGPGRAALIVIGIIIGLFLEFCNFHVFGTFGGWIRYGQFGMFGAMAYLFPAMIIFGFVIAGMEQKRGRLLFFSILLFLMLCCFAHLISPISLNNHDILSYFTTCADSSSGGGILGGTIALGLYLMLSKTGAVIITILVMILCFFFLFEDQIKYLFSYLFSREWEDEDEDEDDREYEKIDFYEMEEPKQQKPVRSRRRKIDRAYEEYLYSDGYEEDPDREDINGRKRAENRRRKVQETRSRELQDGPVYITEHPDETIIRIVKSKRPKAPEHEVELNRSSRKAQPIRDGSTEVTRTEKKGRGISQATELKPHNANGDEIHEITRRQGTAVTKEPSKRDFFEQTVIKPEGEDQLEWNTPAMKAAEPEPDVMQQARVTKVTQAAVNRKEREERMARARQKYSAEPAAVKDSAPAPKAPAVNRHPVPPEGTGQTFHSPPLELLARVKGRTKSSEAELEKIAENLEIILEQFGVHATVTDIQAGPSVTRFELQPELGTRVNRITSLADDLKLNLGVTEIRIEAPIPGRQAVGIEIPNKNRQTVFMRELIEEPALVNHPSKIAFAAGKDISGNVVVADIAKMPHLLVAGTTGSGKSVFLNTILMTILYRAKPSEVGLIIVDPKKVEFGVYQGIPHLMKDVVTDPTQAVSTLRWAVSEMTNRYQRMQMSAVRDFKSYNAKVEKGTVSPEEENPRKMNQIVIIIDELADLMMVAKKEAEALICRIAQLARAAGIHLIIATQRPSVDVVTGLIKANVPGRVALLVSSQIDSRTIIDMPGAEKLLGNGDMLFYPTGYVKPVRVQGAYVSDDEIQMTVDYLIHNNRHDYFAEESKEIEKFMNSSSDDKDSGSDKENSDGSSKYDEFFYEAGKLCIEMGKASSSMLQRRFNLGFNRAARIIDQLEEFGAVGPQQGAKPREILVDTMTFEEMYQALN